MSDCNKDSSMMSEDEFICNISGKAENDFLNNAPIDADEEELAAFKKIESQKHHLRKEAQDNVPVTRSWRYESSWQGDKLIILYKKLRSCCGDTNE